MEAYTINGFKDSSKEHQRWLRFRNKFESGGGYYGELSIDRTDRDKGLVFVLRMPFMEESWFDEIVGSQEPSDLPALADEVAKTICDTNTKEAFKKFANLLIEKVEKK